MLASFPCVYSCAEAYVRRSRAMCIAFRGVEQHVNAHMFEGNEFPETSTLDESASLPPVEPDMPGGTPDKPNYLPNETYRSTLSDRRCCRKMGRFVLGSVLYSIPPNRVLTILVVP